MPAAALWICCWAYFGCAGWLLAALHQLNTAAYAAALLPALGFARFWLRRHPPAFSAQKFLRRFRRPLPAVFLGAAFLTFLGGALYAPANYDALTYRLPRLLNWFVAHRWFWIPTINERVNYSGVAWEWTAMPLLALTRSDRALFLIDWSGFLLLPGLLFSIFRQLGVGPRVARAWMWILPLAFGYVTQAGSIGNDLPGAGFCLLSVCFGLRARRSGRFADVWLALLAAALLTGIKLSNAPLALPCLVAVWPALRRLREHLVASFFLAGVAITISSVPIMALNHAYACSWTGDPNNQYQMQVKNVRAAFLGNSLLLAGETAMPPLLPNARKLTEVLDRKLPASWAALLKQDFPRFYLAKLGEVPGEEGSGLGLGIIFLLFVGAVGAGIGWGRIAAAPRPHFRSLVWLAAWVAGLVYMAKMGSEATARLMLPYYPLLLVPCLLLPGHNVLRRRRVEWFFAATAALSILPALVLSASRPLWPGRTVCAQLAASHPANAGLRRMAAVYSTYAHRNDLLAPLRAQLPADAGQIGFIAGSNDADYSLWRPFGRRRVIDLRYDAPQFLKQPGDFRWLVVKDEAWPDICAMPLADWAQTNHFQVVSSTVIVELVSWGGQSWTVLRQQ
jgi:hypothetical protein